MFISRKRLKRLEGDIEGLRRELDAMRSFLDVNREGYRWHMDSPSMRDIYAAFEQTHDLKRAAPRKWAPK